MGILAVPEITKKTGIRTQKNKAAKLVQASTSQTHRAAVQDQRLPKEVILQELAEPGRELSVGERLPAALLSGGTWALRQRGLSLQDALEQPEKAAEALVAVNEEVRSDIIWPGSGYHNILAKILGGQVKFRPGGNIDVVNPALTELTELDKFAGVDLEQAPEIIALRRLLSLVNDKVGNEFLVGTSAWGPFTMAGQLYGVEKVMAGVYRDKIGIHRLLEYTTELTRAYLEPAINNGARIVSIADPSASGDLISLAHFEEFAAPYIAKLVKRLQSAGAAVVLHICGNVKNRLPLVSALGVDLLSLDYKVSLSLARSVLGGKTAFAGNVNPVLLASGSPQQVEAEARAAIKQAGEGNSFILMPGCDIPPAVPLENVKKFLAIGRNFYSR